MHIKPNVSKLGIINIASYEYYETSSGLLSIGVDILLEDLKELGKELENPESIKLFEEYTTPILNYL